MNNRTGDSEHVRLAESRESPAGEQAEIGKKTGLLNGIAILTATVLLAIAITAVLFRFQAELDNLGNYGYVGAFLIGLIASATVVVPVPGVVALAALGTSLNPVLVGLAGATGGIIGEITGFMVGFGGRKVIHGRSRLYVRLEEFMRRWGFWAIFIIAAAPLPVFDVAGIISGALHYPLWKFLLVGWAGKCIKGVYLVVAGAWGWEYLLRFFVR